MRATDRSARLLGALVLTGAALASVGAVGAGGGDAVPRTPPAAPVAERAADAVVGERTVIDTGHVDAIATRLVDGEFRTLFKDSRDPAAVVWREPASVVMHLSPAGEQTVPDPPGGLGFLGEPGDAFHLIPQVQDPDVLWAGWNTENFAAADLQGRFTLSLDAIEGPGALVIWGWSPFGEPLPRFDTRDGMPDGYEVAAGTHEHANWAFTEEGVYRMTFTFSSTLASGEQVSDSQVFTMAVGDIDPDDVPLPGDGGSSDGGSSDGGTTDGGTSGTGSGGADDGGTTDSGGITDGGTGDDGSTDSGGTTNAGNSDGGATDDGSAGGSSRGTTADGGSTGSGTGTGGSPGSDTSGTSGTTATGGGTSPDGALAGTGADAMVPLVVLSATLIALGAGTFAYVSRRKARTAGGDTAAPGPAGT